MTFAWPTWPDHLHLAHLIWSPPPGPPHLVTFTWPTWPTWPDHLIWSPPPNPGWDRPIISLSPSCSRFKSQWLPFHTGYKASMTSMKRNEGNKLTKLDAVTWYKASMKRKERNKLTKLEVDAVTRKVLSKQMLSPVKNSATQKGKSYFKKSVNYIKGNKKHFQPSAHPWLLSRGGFSPCDRVGPWKVLKLWLHWEIVDSKKKVTITTIIIIMTI